VCPFSVSGNLSVIMLQVQSRRMVGCVDRGQAIVTSPAHRRVKSRKFPPNAVPPGLAQSASRSLETWPKSPLCALRRACGGKRNSDFLRLVTTFKPSLIRRQAWLRSQVSLYGYRTSGELSTKHGPGLGRGEMKVKVITAWRKRPLSLLPFMRRECHCPASTPEGTPTETTIPEA